MSSSAPQAWSKIGEGRDCLPVLHGGLFDHLCYGLLKRGCSGQIWKKGEADPEWLGRGGDGDARKRNILGGQLIFLAARNQPPRLHFELAVQTSRLVKQNILGGHAILLAAISNRQGNMYFACRLQAKPPSKVHISLAVGNSHQITDPRLMPRHRSTPPPAISILTLHSLPAYPTVDSLMSWNFTRS